MKRLLFVPWRQLLFSALLLLAMGMAVTACSSEETEDFTIQFRLEDENGNPKNEFRQGENIIFRLTIYNNTDAHYSINDWGSLFGGKVLGNQLLYSFYNGIHLCP